MTVRFDSGTVVITDTATPGQTLYTAPKVGGAEVTCVVYASNVDGVAARTVTVEHDRGAAHTTTGIAKIVDAMSLEPNWPQLKLCTVVLKGHKTDPDTLDVFASVTSDIVIVWKVEERR